MYWESITHNSRREIEIENDFGTAFAGNLRNGGGRSSVPEQQATNNETSENVELVGMR